MSSLLQQLPKHNCGLYLEHNPHKDCYEDVETFTLLDDSWVSPEECQKAIISNELWTLQWYPDTPIGFHRVMASTLEAILSAVQGR